MASTNTDVSIPSDEVSSSYRGVAQWDIILPACKLAKKMLALLESHDPRDGLRLWIKVTEVDTKSIIGSVVITGEKFNGEKITHIVRTYTQYIVRRNSIPRKE